MKGHSYQHTEVCMAPFQDGRITNLPHDYLRLLVSSAPDLDGALVRITSEQISLRFTPAQARALAAALLEHADRVEVPHD